MSDLGWFLFGYGMAVMTVASGVGFYQWVRYRRGR